MTWYSQADVEDTLHGERIKEEGIGQPKRRI